MTLGNWFWIFVVLSFVSWGYGIREAKYAPYAYFPFFIPLVIVGWQVFGSVVK
jgi:hypothetical protein